MTEKLINALSELQENINELNKQINAEINHNEITPENSKDFTEFFDPKINAVQTSYDRLKSIIN